MLWEGAVISVAMNWIENHVYFKRKKMCFQTSHIGSVRMYSFRLGPSVKIFPGFFVFVF